MFVTKYRKDVFDDAMLKRCEEIMRKVCSSFETELKEFNGERDHVHLLVHYPPKIALSKLINRLRDVSSRYLRAEYTARINRSGWAPCSGHAPTSPDRATAHPSALSASTSRARNGPPDRRRRGAANSGAARLRSKNAFPSPAEAGDTHARSGMGAWSAQVRTRARVRAESPGPKPPNRAPRSALVIEEAAVPLVTEGALRPAGE